MMCYTKFLSFLKWDRRPLVRTGVEELLPALPLPRSPPRTWCRGSKGGCWELARGRWDGFLGNSGTKKWQGVPQQGKVTRDHCFSPPDLTREWGSGRLILPPDGTGVPRQPQQAHHTGQEDHWEPAQDKQWGKCSPSLWVWDSPTFPETCEARPGTPLLAHQQEPAGA